MKFIAHTQDELRHMQIKEGSQYLVEYLNKDYFNGEETLEQARANAILNDNKIMFIVPDPFGMERFIEKVRVIR